MPRGKKPLDSKLRSGLLTKNANDFIKKCQQELNKVFVGYNLSFNKISEPGNKELFILTGKNVSRASAKFQYLVIPILTSESGHFWLSLTFEFEYEKAAPYLMSVSIICFEGNYTDDEKHALLRAEWDCVRETPPPPHAQPHWHIYENQLDILNLSYTNDIELQEFDPLKLDENIYKSTKYYNSVTNWSKCEKFHFALSAKWQTDGLNSHIEELRHDWVINWVCGCMKYIQSQLQSIYCK